MKKDTLIYIAASSTALIIMTALIFAAKPNTNELPSVTSTPSPTETAADLHVDGPVHDEVSPNALVEWICAYSECGHEYTFMDASLVIGMTEEEVEQAFPDWSLSGFSRSKVTLRSSADTFCPIHYLLKYNGNALAVFSTDAYTHKQFELMRLVAEVDSFPKEEIKKLTSGIVFNTLREIDSYIEAFDS